MGDPALSSINLTMKSNPRQSISDTGFHSWSYFQRSMDFAEVVIHEMQGDRVHVVFNFLAESVGQSGKVSHAHTHG